MPIFKVLVLKISIFEVILSNDIQQYCPRSQMKILQLPARSGHSITRARLTRQLVDLQTLLPNAGLGLFPGRKVNLLYRILLPYLPREQMFSRLAGRRRSVGHKKPASQPVALQFLERWRIFRHSFGSFLLCLFSIFARWLRVTSLNAMRWLMHPYHGTMKSFISYKCELLGQPPPSAVANKTVLCPRLDTTSHFRRSSIPDLLFISYLQLFYSPIPSQSGATLLRLSPPPEFVAPKINAAVQGLRSSLTLRFRQSNGPAEAAGSLLEFRILRFRFCSIGSGLITGWTFLLDDGSAEIESAANWAWDFDVGLKFEAVPKVDIDQASSKGRLCYYISRIDTFTVTSDLHDLHRDWSK